MLRQADCDSGDAGLPGNGVSRGGRGVPGIGAGLWFRRRRAGGSEIPHTPGAAGA